MFPNIESEVCVVANDASVQFPVTASVEVAAVYNGTHVWSYIFNAVL